MNDRLFKIVEEEFNANSNSSQALGDATESANVLFTSATGVSVFHLFICGNVGDAIGVEVMDAVVSAIVVVVCVDLLTVVAE